MVDKQRNRRFVIVAFIVIILGFVGNVAFWIGTGADGNRTAALILGAVLLWTIGAVFYGRRRRTL